MMKKIHCLVDGIQRSVQDLDVLLACDLNDKSERFQDAFIVFKQPRNENRFGEISHESDSN